MASSFWQVFRQGQTYARIWPRHAVVAAMTETRVVPAVSIAAKMMPAAAVLSFLVQWQTFGQALLPQATVTSIFLLSLPLQGWYWLGRRSEAPLPPQLLRWYQDLAAKLKVKGQGEPTYMDLARILRKALNELPPDQH